MTRPSDILRLSFSAIRAHKLRASLTILGITMGVATLIAVMTLIQGANSYVEKKIANLGTNVFQVARTPFAATDFELVMKALRFRHIEIADMRAIAEACPLCEGIGATASFNGRAQFEGRELSDVAINGQTANMAEIDTRTVEQGRFFLPVEEQHEAFVCLIGQKVVDELFPGRNPVGATMRLAQQEFRVIGVFEKIGSILGQEQDNFAVIPLSVFLRLRGQRNSLTLNVLVTGGDKQMEAAQDEVRQVLRARRHLAGNQPDDFYFGTKESYMQLWASISGAFFVVFTLVSAISAVVGGIVIMNVMLVSVTERTKEIGIRRAVGATQQDIRRQFLSESVIQCLLGGLVGVSIGFLSAIAVRNLAEFPAEVKTWVAIFGLTLSSAIGLFFGIVPAMRAARLDPVVALRKE